MEVEVENLRERVEILEKTLQEMNNIVKRKFELVFTFFNNKIDLLNKFQDERSKICQNYLDELNSIAEPALLFNSSSTRVRNHRNPTPCDLNDEICRSPIVETELIEPIDLNIKVENPDPHFEDESDSILPNLENDEDNGSLVITRNNDFLLASSSSSQSTNRATIDSNHSHYQTQHLFANNLSFQPSQPQSSLVNFDTSLYHKLSHQLTPENQIPTVVKQKVHRAKVAKIINPVLEMSQITITKPNFFNTIHTSTRPNRKKRHPIKRRFPTNEKRSSIWSHFTQVMSGSEEMAKCVYCESLQQPRTDRLRIHLRNHLQKIDE